MRRARAELAGADVAILVTDTQNLEVDRRLLAECADTATRLFVHNKIDLGDETAHIEHDGEKDIHVYLSALHGDGLAELRAELARLAGHGEGTQGAFSARTRHVDALERVAEHLQAAERSLSEQRAGELAADELQQAQRALGEVTGEYSSDDLLGAIFSTFCIGK
jgi:tRNA modification GTPase